MLHKGANITRDEKLRFQRYDSVFFHDTTSIFPIDLQEKLWALDVWSGSEVSTDEAAAIIADLSQLPPDAIMIAGAEIPELLGMGEF